MSARERKYERSSRHLRVLVKAFTSAREGISIYPINKKNIIECIDKSNRMCIFATEIINNHGIWTAK